MRSEIIDKAINREGTGVGIVITKQMYEAH